MFDQNSGVNARNVRIERTMQVLRDMLKNCQQQEGMGLPVDPVEKQFYANIGIALKGLLGKDDMDFNLEAAILIKKLTGQAPQSQQTQFNQHNQGQPQQQPQQPNVGGQPNISTTMFQQGGFNTTANQFNQFTQNQGIRQALAQAGFVQHLAVDYVKLVAQCAEVLVAKHNWPEQEAVMAAGDAVMEIAKHGIHPSQVVGVKVVEVAQNSSMNPFGGKGNISPADMFDQILKQDPNNNNQGGFGFGGSSEPFGF